MAKKKRTKRPKPATKRRAKRRIRLMVIPEPEPNTRSIIKFTGGEGVVLMKGPGNMVMECGDCGRPLIEGVPVNRIQSIVFVCPDCGAFNDSLA